MTLNLTGNTDIRYKMTSSYINKDVRNHEGLSDLYEMMYKLRSNNVLSKPLKKPGKKWV